MPAFPQLTLYPVTRRANSRTVVNTLPDGNIVAFSDPNGAWVEWEMEAKGLTAAEWESVQMLHQTVSGQWQTFTFLDPVGNLLAQSENFSASAWTNGPLLALTAGVNDPFGTSRATRVVNAGQAAQAIAQTLAAPGNYLYTLSVWARTSAGSNVTLAMGGVSQTFAATSQWRRISLSANPGQSAAGVTFGAQLDPGASADLFGMQVEAQAGVSDYKQTGAQGGVYSNARFALDGLTVRAQSTDVYDATIRIVSMGN
ncbi:MAG TPA: hypothetical protein VKV74_00200 [Bryobacteraceae bacterium]|nr:hypothetical protein [Bryobacteraceae bacterium]